MPKSFSDCVRSGGKVRTKSLPGNKHLKICYKNKASYAGHVKKNKGKR